LPRDDVFFTTPSIHLAGVGFWGGGYWFLIPLLFLLFGVPLLDQLTGWQDDGHFHKEGFTKLELWLLDWNTRLYVIFYMATVVFLAISVDGFNTMEIGMLLGSLSLLGGIGFAAAHELLHAKKKIDQVLTRLVTTFLFYPHYKLIHIRNHHVHASTDHDENTAWLNESIYAYIIRTIPGSMLRSWKMEAKRVGIFHNKMLLYAAGQVAILLLMYAVAGNWGLLFYLAHIVGSHIVLESVNYIQHYGLLRKKLDENEDTYEKTGGEHSWDSYHYFFSYVTFRVGHHSYHHIAVKPYYLLETVPEAPKLPTGYFWTIAMVMLPPWWRRVSHPKIEQPTP
jgi:alkane 1-monooxygenase